MDDDKGKQLLNLMFLASCATIAWFEVKNQKELPTPSRFVGAGLTYGILALVTPLFGAGFTALMGAGFYLVLLYKFFNNGTEGPTGAQIVGGATPGIGTTPGTIIGSVVSPNIIREAA